MQRSITFLSSSHPSSLILSFRLPPSALLASLAGDGRAAGLLGLLFGQRSGPVLLAPRRSGAAWPAGNRRQRLAVPPCWPIPDRLLTAVLFWNLLVNLAYFTLTSSSASAWKHRGGTAAAGLFAVGALLAIIVFGEMLPKTWAVLQPRSLAAVLAVPLAAAVRLLDPLLPAFRLANCSRGGCSGRGSRRSPTCKRTTWNGRCGSRRPMPPCCSRSNGCWRTSSRFRKSAPTN